MGILNSPRARRITAAEGQAGTVVIVVTIRSGSPILAFLDTSPFWCQVPRPRCSGDHIHGAVPENRRDQTTVGNPAGPQKEADQECHNDSTASLVTMCQPEEHGRKEQHSPSL